MNTLLRNLGLVALTFLGMNYQQVHAQVKTPIRGKATSLVGFNNVTNLTIAGDSGQIYYSADGGKNWVPDTSATSNKINQLVSGQAANTWQRYAVGDSGTFMFSDGGPTNKRAWRKINTGTKFNLHAVTGSGSWYGGDALAVGDSGLILAHRYGRDITFRMRLNTSASLTALFTDLYTSSSNGIGRVRLIAGDSEGKLHILRRDSTQIVNRPDTSFVVRTFNFDSLTTSKVVSIVRQSRNTAAYYVFFADGTLLDMRFPFDAVNPISFRAVNYGSRCGTFAFGAGYNVGQAWNVTWTIAAGADGKLVAFNPTSNPTFLCSQTGFTDKVVSLYAVQSGVTDEAYIVALSESGNFTSTTKGFIKPAQIAANGPVAFCKYGAAPTLTDTVAGNYAYQWFRNGVAVPNATAASIVASDSGTYTLRRRAFNFLFNYNNNTIPTTYYGPDTLSAGVKVSYLPAPARPAIVAVGSDSLNASVVSAARYTWLYNGTPLPDTTSGIKPTLTGRYRAIATNATGCSSDTSLVYNFFVCRDLGRLLNRTRDTAICRGQTVTLRYTPATGVTPTYQWFRNDQPIATGGTTNSFAAADSGTYFVRMVINNCLVFSDTVFVDVDAIPSVPVMPVTGTQTICSGDSLVLVAPAGFARYRWVTNTQGTAIYKDTTSNRLVLRSAVAGLRLRVLTGAGCASPVSTTTLTTTLGANINTNLSLRRDTALCQGNNFILRYTYTGTGTPRYQWFKNNTAVPTGGTNNLITITDSGAYQLRVNVGTCTTFTNTIRVSINPAPTAPTLTVPTTNLICGGDSLVVNAPGGFARYRWVTGTTGTTVFLDTTSPRLVLRTAVSGLRLRVITAAGCLSPTSAPFNTTLQPRPSKPSISQNGNTLTASFTPAIPGVTYRWYFEGQLVTGNIGSTYTGTANGVVKVIVVNNGCVSDTSDPFTLVSASRKVLQGQLKLIPNPSNLGYATVELAGVNAEVAAITLTDLQGRTLSATEVYLVNGNANHQLQLQGLAKGVYLVKVDTNQGSRTDRLVVQ